MTGAPNFDHLAKSYRWLEYLSLGPFLTRARNCYLNQLGARKNALVLGDGDGRFTASLLHDNRSVYVHAVDVSPGMLRALQKSADANVKRVSVEIADLRYWQPSAEARFDLIATHFFLDCLTTKEIEELALRLDPVTEENALWVISDFHVPANRFGRWFAAPFVASLYYAFRILTGLAPDTLPDHRLALGAAGWKLEAEQLQLRGLLLSQLWRYDPAFGLKSDPNEDRPPAI